MGAPDLEDESSKENMELYEVVLLFSTGALFIVFFLLTCYYVCGLNPNRNETLRQASYQLKLTNVSVDNRKFLFKSQNIHTIGEDNTDKYENNQNISIVSETQPKLLPFANELKLEPERRFVLQD